jgi:uncharacterized membrane protein
MNTLFITIRTIHIVLAAIWFGGTFLMAMYLGPVVQDLGPSGGAVMSGMVKRGFDKMMAIVGGTAVLSGIWLYWRLTQSFDTSLMSSRVGLIFGVGGLVGIAAGMVGGSVVGRSSKALFALGTKMGQMQDGPEKAAAIQEVAVLRARIASGSRVLLVLLTATMVLMTVGRYVR